MSDTQDSSSRSSPRYVGPAWIWLAGVILLSGLVKFINLDHTSLWLDEIHTFMMVNVHPIPEQLPAEPWTAEYYYRHFVAWQPMDWDILVRKLQENVHMPLYYLLLNPWLEVFGNDAIGLRSFSVFFSCLMLLPVYGLGRALGGRSVAFWSLFVAAFVPFQIYWAQEGRMYTLAMFWAAASALGLWKTFYGRHPVRWAVFYAFTLAGGFFSHYIFSFYLFFHLVFGVAKLIRRPDRRDWLLVLPALALGVCVWFWWPVYQAQTAHVDESSHFAKTLVSWSRYLTALVWNPMVTVAGDNKLLRVFYFPFVILLTLWYFVRLRSRQWTFKMDGFLWCWILVPLLVQIGYDMVERSHTVVIDRYTLLIAPGVYLLMGLAMADLYRYTRGRKIVYGLAAGMLAAALLNVSALEQFRDEHNKKNIRRRVHYMAEHARPGDLILANGPFAAACIAAYYLHDRRPDQPILFWINPYRGEDVPLPSTEVLARYDRLWLFLYRATDARGLPELRSWLPSQYAQGRPAAENWYLYSR